MSISKDSYERARSKAQARLLEWTEETKTAGTKRLLDRNGEMFKRIEYKGKDVSEKSKNLKALEVNDKSKVKQKSSKDTVSVVASKTQDGYKSGQSSDFVKQHSRSSQNKHLREKFTKICGIETVCNLCNDDTPGNCKLPPISQSIPDRENRIKQNHEQNSIGNLHKAGKLKSTPYSTTAQEKLVDDACRVKTAKQSEIDDAVGKIMRESYYRRKRKKHRATMRRDQDETSQCLEMSSCDDVERERSLKIHEEQQTHLLSEFPRQLNEIRTSDAAHPTSTRTASIPIVSTKHTDKSLPPLQSARINYRGANEVPRLVKAGNVKPIRNTLKRCVRKLMYILHLLRVLKQRVKADLLTECQYQMGVDKRKALERMAFDPGYFRPVTSLYSVGLSNSARKAFWTPIAHRTPEDAQLLMEVINRLPCFVKYPRSVREKLAHVAWYDEFENDRVLLRQGHVGSRMYFVISGCASVQITQTDPKTKSEITRHLYDVYPWSSFGELALVRNKVNFTVICKGKSEFISLSKDEYDSILRIYYDDSWNKRYNFFRSSVYFEKLSDAQIQEMTDMSEIREISHNKIVHSDTKGQTVNVFFLYSGKCDIQKKVSFVPCVSPYVPTELMYQKSKSARRLCRREYHYFTVLRLKAGDYFGVGEDLTDMFVISKGRAGVIFLKAFTFNSNYTVTHGHILQEERENLIHTSPHLVKRFKERGKWLEFKKKVIEEVVLRMRRKNTNCVEYSDVPGISHNQNSTQSHQRSM